MEKLKVIQKARSEQRTRLEKMPMPIDAKPGDFISSKERKEALFPHKGKFTEKKCTEKEVFAEFRYSKDNLAVNFNFPDSHRAKVKEIPTGAFLHLNEDEQVVRIFIINFSKNFGSGKKIKTALEKDKKARLNFSYSKTDDVLDIRFSSRKPTDFENDPEYMGVIRQYAGRELVGYLLVDFSDPRSVYLKAPQLGIRR